MPEVVSGLEDALFHSTSKSLAEASIHASVLSKREKGSEGTNFCVLSANSQGPCYGPV